MNQLLEEGVGDLMFLDEERRGVVVQTSLDEMFSVKPPRPPIPPRPIPPHTIPPRPPIPPRPVIPPQPGFVLQGKV